MSSGLHLSAGLHERLVNWLRDGDVGLSSRSMAAVMAGTDLLAPSRCYRAMTPSDPSDLTRCLKLLERFPEWRGRLAEMRGVSDEWGRLVAAWDVVTDIYMREAAAGDSGPLTWVALECCNRGPADAMRLAARQGVDLLAASQTVDAVTATWGES